MTPAQALADAFPLLIVADDGSGTLAMVLLDGEVLVVQVDPDGATAHRHRLHFAAVAAGRTPEEALAGLLSPVAARVGRAA